MERDVPSHSGVEIGSRVLRSIRCRKPTRIIGVHPCPGRACLSIVPHTCKYYSNYQEVPVIAVRKSGCLTASLMSLMRGTNCSATSAVKDLKWRKKALHHTELDSTKRTPKRIESHLGIFRNDAWKQATCHVSQSSQPDSADCHF